MSQHAAHRRHRLRVSAALALACCVRPSQAAPETRSNAPLVSVSLLECPEETFPFVQVVDTLRVELAGSGLECCAVIGAGTAMPDSAYFRVSLQEVGECKAVPERVRISVQRLVESRPLERELSLGDVAEAARPRALALAVAELIRELSHEPREEPPSKASAATSPARARESAPVRAASTSYALRVAGDVRRFPARGTTPWGGRVGLAAQRAWSHAEFDLGLNTFSTQTALGELLVRSASAGLGAGPRITSASLNFEVGPRLEFGWVWIRGNSTQEGVHTDAGSGAMLNVGLRAALDLRLAPSVAPCLELEAGQVLRGVNGNVDGERTAGIGGYYLRAALGLTVPL